MIEFYTDVSISGNNILYRGYKDGKKVKKRLTFKPSLFIPSPKPTKYTSVRNKFLDKVDFDSIGEAKEFIRNYENVENFEIYGNQRFEYSFIAEYFKGHVHWEVDHIDIAYLDIEVKSDDGYATPENPFQEINAISVKRKHGFDVWGLGHYDPSQDNYGVVRYHQCKSERELLESFLEYWTSDYPDVISGWFVRGFDIPYIIARLEKVLGEDVAKTFSPWKYYYKKSRMFLGKENQTIYISGIAILDYRELYMKISKNGKSQESFSLNNICYVELGEKKLDYSEYANLNQLYKQDHQKFISYNIRDTGLVDSLDNKMKLMELAFTLAYNAKVNLEDIFMQVRMWDILIFNKLLTKNIILSPNNFIPKQEYPGGYVKETLVGKHKWVVSFDLTSLYPMLIQEFNISPDTLIEFDQYTDEIKEKILDQTINVDTLFHKKVNTEYLKTCNLALAANAHLFDRNKKGFLAEMMEEMFDLRKSYKDQMLEYQKKIENEKDPVKKKELGVLASRFENLQETIKICLNSAYGAMGNNYFRYYDVRLAEAVTSSGQLAIRWVARDINGYLNKILKTDNRDYIIASDTDSMYLNLEEMVKQAFSDKEASTEKIISYLDDVCKKILHPMIEKSFESLADYLHVYAQKMNMKREVIAETAIWTSKKHYILSVWNKEGVAYTKPKIKIVGMEGIKSSTPEICRKKLKEAYEISVNKTEKDMIKFISDFRKEFNELSPGAIASPRGMNGLEKFTIDPKGAGPHVKGSIAFNRMLKEKKLERKYEAIKEGEKIKFIHLKSPNPFGSETLSFMNVIPEEFEIEKWIDYKTQFEKSFIEPLEIVLKVIGWKSKKVNSLSALGV